MTAPELTYNGYASALLRYDNGERALWVRDDYCAGTSDTPGTYSLNDVNNRIPLEPDEDLAPIIEEWKLAVGWDA